MEEEKKYENLIAELSKYYSNKKKLVSNKVMGVGIPANSLSLSYNSSAESMEPVYFWLLDFMGGKGVEKIEDTFQSTVGSGHFSELMGKATRMQEEGMKVMQTIGVLIKSVINIIYDLKQFEIRLHDYDVANEKDKNANKESGVLALKQTWLDNVDIKRGNSSIKAMTFSQQGAFVTLLNAFFMVNSEADVDKADLNEIVKRVLKQRIQEFLEWKKYSELELKKRYDIERHWLKSQVDSLKLYSRWAAPYFEAAETLRMNEDKTNPDLVNAFNSIVLKLVLLKSDSIDVSQEVYDKNLPKGFDKLSENKKIRPFFACNIIEFRFRGIPTREGQHYGFGGRTDVYFKSFGLNKDELDVFKAKLKNSELNEALKMAKSVTTTSLEEIQKDIEYFTKDVDERDKPEEKEESEKNKSDVNPFSALLGFGTLWGKDESPSKNKPKDKADKEKLKEEERINKLIEKGVPADNFAEKIVRAYAELKAKKTAFTVYDVYKKSHGMASQPFGDYSSTFQASDMKVGFTDVFQK